MPIRGTGYAPVRTSITCVLTRFEVRSVWALLRLYYMFRQVRAQARDVGGLLSALFLVEGWRTCYTLSFWQDESAILRFNGEARAHVMAANYCFRDLAATASGPQLWSAQFDLAAISPHNLQWKEMSREILQQHIMSDPERLERSACPFERTA